MLKGEIQILSAIILNKCTAKQIMSSRLARSSSYISSTIISLERRGYIIKRNPKGYQLTDKGARAFLEFCPNRETLIKLAQEKLLHRYTDRAKEAIDAIKILGIKYNNILEDNILRANLS